MKYKLKFVSLLGTAVLSLSSSQIFASGYALNEQSASAMGMANAGAAANPENATTLYFNPAGLVHLEKAQVSGGITFLDVNSDFKGSATDTVGQPVSGGDGGDYVSLRTIPNLYYSRPINDSVSAGIGVYAPYGVAGEYDEDFVGRFFADETEVRGIAVQPTMAFKLNDEFSAGLGIIFIHMDGKLSKAQEYSGTGLPSALLREGHFEVEGHDNGIGWNFGLMYQPSNDTTLGFNFRTKVDLTLEGDAHLTNVPVATGGNPPVAYVTRNEKAKVPLTLPETATFSLKHDLNDQWSLYGGATWTRWSRFQNLDIFTREEAGFGEISARSGVMFNEPGMIGHVRERWKNVWAFSVGVSYDYSERLTVKAGYAYDESPVQKEYRTARVPSTDRNWITLGAQYRMENDLVLDGAIGYLLIDDVELDESTYTVDDQRVGLANVEGTYDLSAYGLAFQVTKSF
ncbi:OmpP1/FadL family transporter [Hahella ganghwensis]|uniref:OmpP1/FadL family transporter n=1 Tax=Hahella ganghwensis TaxID=286420 RepID=UPI00037CB5E6|nr:outer membrane protein transport protein [Hahella ganghwensis]